MTDRNVTMIVSHILYSTAATADDVLLLQRQSMPIDCLLGCKNKNVVDQQSLVCRPLAPGPYNVTASMKGYSSVSVQVIIPDHGGGLVHDFVLPCTTCKDSQMGTLLKPDYIQEVITTWCFALPMLSQHISIEHHTATCSCSVQPV